MLPHTWNCDRETLPDGKLRSRFGVKWRNWLDSGGVWQPIQAAPTQVGNLFQVAQAPYRLECPKLATGDFRFDATTRWDIHRKQAIATAASGVTKRFPGAAAVTGVVSGYEIRYPAAMPSIGADIAVLPHEQKVRFVYEWQAAPAGATPFVECPIEFEFAGVPELARKAGDRSIATTDRSIGEPLTYAANSNRGVTIKRARVWDSRGKWEWISLRLRRVGNRLVGVKLVPRSFLAAAFAAGATWVRTDTTSTFYPDADAESTTVDGYVYFSGDASWSSARDDGGGSSYADDNATSAAGARAQMSNTTNQYWSISRVAMLFDTSAIPEDDTVSESVLSIYGSFASNGGGWSDGFAVVTSSPSSNTALTGNDFPGFGTSDKGASQFTVAGWSGGGYNAVTLSDNALVDKAGITKLGVRQVDDMYGSEPSWTDSSSIQLGQYFADETGTDKDPKLVVTHAPPASGGHKFCGKINSLILTGKL